MAKATSGERSILFEGSVYFWEEAGSVYFSIHDPELNGHSAIGTVQDGSDAYNEIHAVLEAKGRKTD